MKEEVKEKIEELEIVSSMQEETGMGVLCIPVCTSLCVATGGTGLVVAGATGTMF